jgi:hypothetical protein
MIRIVLSVLFFISGLSVMIYIAMINLQIDKNPMFFFLWVIGVMCITSIAIRILP